MLKIKPEEEWLRCNKCMNDTKHKLLYNYEKRRSHNDFEDELDRYDSLTKREFLQCSGCEEVVLRTFDWVTQDGPIEYCSPTRFPPLVKRAWPQWAYFDNPPIKFKSLLYEIYAAFNVHSHCLAMMGARAMIDLFIREKVHEDIGFAKGLEELKNIGLISADEQEILTVAVDVGHAAVHDGYVPTLKVVNVVIDIIERLLHTAFLKKETQDIKKYFLPRNQK